MIETIKKLIDAEAQLSIPARDLTPWANLYELGLTPYSAIRLLLATERAFDVEFPRRLLNKDSMASIRSISDCLCALRRETPLLDAA